MSELSLTFQVLGGVQLRKAAVSADLHGLAEDWVRLVEANEGDMPLEGLWNMAKVVSLREMDQEAFVSHSLNLLHTNKEKICSLKDWRAPLDGTIR